jgi:hypothetical protein
MDVRCTKFSRNNFRTAYRQHRTSEKKGPLSMKAILNKKSLVSSLKQGFFN